MTDSGNIKAVAFDAYGTLFDVHSVISACDDAFPGKGQAISQLWRAKQLEYTWLTSLMGRYQDFWQVTANALEYACKYLSLDLTPDVRQSLMSEYLSLDTYPEVRDALNALSERNTCILSNGAPLMLHSAVDSAELSSSLGYIISADEAKVFKPSPKVYQLAVDKLSLAASEICFVSSNSWDVIGATAFGFWTCWVNRQNAPLDELGITPNLVVGNLTELVAALDSA